MKVKNALKALTRLCVAVALLLGAHWRASAQTTITTSTTANFGVAGITFVVENTNPYPVQITTMGLHVQATSNGGTATLYASTTSLSGTTTIPSAPWTTVASAPIVSAGLGVLPIFNGLTYTIPATSAVRFGITTTTNLIIGNPGVNTYSSAGVNLRRGNYVIGGLNVGFAAGTLPNFTFNPYDYNGFITFIPIVPCAGVPAPGATTSNVLGACIGQNITLGLQNSTSGTGVTYAWEFDNGGGWTSFGTSAATQTVTQSASTSYRCTVTCTEPGGGSQTSTPITIGMAGSLPVEFTQTFFPSNCWVRSGTAAAFVARDNANGFGLPGTGSAKWDFWNAGAGTTQIITSPDFAPLTGTNQVVFDVAGAKWTDAAIDQITLEYSTSGSGGPWTVLAVMNNALGGELNTGGEVATAFTPSAAQWAQRSYAIPAGATNIRFAGLAGFGNNVFIDNIDIEEMLMCATPTGVAANLLTPSSAEATWTLNGADSYDIELRTSGAPGSGPAGLADSGTALVPPFSLTVVLGQTYFLYVRANCGVFGFSTWSAPASLTVDYCATTAIVGTNDPVINQFNYGGINNVNASNAGYLDFTAQTAFVVPGVPTALFLDRTTDFALDSLFIWVDLNNDLDFDDAGELVYTSPALFPDPLNAFITIPNGTSPGDKRMRVRRVNMTGGFGWTSPCGTAPFGQTHDYTVNVCGFPEATATVIDDCGNSEFSIAVDITSNPGGPLTINWVATPGGPGSMPASLGLNNLPTFPTNASVSISVSNGSLCELDLGDHFSNCPITVNCGDVVTVQHCYRNNDPRTFTFLASNPSETLTLTFISGTMDANDVIRGYSGTDDSGNSIGGLTGSFANLGAPQVTGSSEGSELYLEIDSDGSNSCASGDQSLWVFEVECTPGCIDPDAAISVTDNCVDYNFTINVEVLFTGDAPTATLRYTVNGGSPIDIPGLEADDVEVLGPFAIDDLVNVRLLHGADAGCDRNFGNFTDLNTCVPGESCVSSILLNVNPLGGCPLGGTPGTNIGATQDGGLFSCVASVGPFADKWFRFNSGSNSAIAYSFTSFTFTSLVVEVFEGGCAGPSVHCAAGGSALSNSFVATPNTDYWLRMASIGTGTGNFTICISAGVPPPDPCASIANISGCGVSTGPVAVPAGTGAWSNNTLGGPYQTPGIERIFTFTATVTGVHTINVTQYTGGNFIDFYWKQVGTCNNAGWNYLSDVGGVGNVAADVLNGGVALNLTAGNTYYIMWDTENTTGRTVAFDVICPVPAPANDACANAITLTPAATCNPVAGSSVGATQSAAPSTCSDFTSSAANDVWYSFTATRTSHRVTVAGQGAFDAIVDLRSGACNGTTVACVDATVNGQTEVLTVGGLTVGEIYLVRVYGWAGGTGAFTICVEEPDCAGVFGGSALPGTSCNDGNPNTVLDVYDANCVCAGQACTTDLTLEVQLDGISTISWFLHEEGSNILVQSGVEFLPGQADITVGTCLPNGCYYLRVEDDGGDGIVNGGYLLRISDGARLIDNRRDVFGTGGFTNGAVSQVAGNEGFCLPLGTDRLVVTSCDKRDWKLSPCGGEFVVANANAAVSAQYGVNNANSGYQMWWYNPNGGYSFKRFQSHNTANGLAASATRACHFMLNSWSGNQLVEGTFYNVKVRGRVNGVYNTWGPACRLVVNSTEAQCPRTKLMDLPGNQYLSCGQTRTIASNQLVHARNVRRMNNNCNWVNANRYQFRFRLPAENITIVKTSATGQYWTNTLGLTCGKTYEVDVRASFDNGATWCHSSDPYGDVCQLTTLCSGAMALESGNANEAGQSERSVGLYPNPNHGDQLFVSMSRLEEGVESINMDFYDAFGKRVAQRTIGVQDGYVNTTIALNGELANGLYMVSITAGTSTFNERLVIQK